MAIFSEDERYSILLTLGYSAESISQFTQLGTNKPTVLYNKVVGWLEEIDTVDEDLEVARSRSMALEVEDAKLDYAQQINALRLKGRELVKQISQATGLPIQWNRFSGGRNSSTIISVM